jgi:hypothetical protein
MNHDMLRDVLEFLQNQEDTHPIGAHPKCFSTWRATTEADFQSHISDHITTDFINSANDIFRGCLEFRADMHARAWNDTMKGSLQSCQTPPSPWEHLLTVTQIAQRTPEWYEEGRRLLTASEFWKLLDTPRTYSSLIVSKLPPAPTAQPRPAQRLACSYADMNAMDWGTCLEAVVKFLLKEQKGWTITDLGRIRYSNSAIPLAASPDGLITAGPVEAVGNLVEIKCPRTRALDSSAVPFEYWCQMQIQMECTNRPACEYVEVKFDLRKVEASVEDYLAGGGAQTSLIALVQNTETCEMRYIYGFDPTFDSVRKGHRMGEQETLLEYTAWTCQAIRHVQIPRDAEWFRSVVPLIQQFACDLEDAQTGKWKPIPPLERKKRVQPAAAMCAIQDSPPSSPQPVPLAPFAQVGADFALAAATPPIASKDLEIP